MATNYTILNQWPSSALQGGSNVVATVEFAVQTKPNSLYFQFRRPKAQLAKLDSAARLAEIDTIADQLAVRIEAVFAEKNVIDIQYSQDTTPAGQISDMEIVYVQSDSGSSVGEVTIPQPNIGPGSYTTSRINAEVEALNDAEGL